MLSFLVLFPALEAGASVLVHHGKTSTPASIGGQIVTRATMAVSRAGTDGVGGGPAPFGKADRSRFLKALDAVVVRGEAEAIERR